MSDQSKPTEQWPAVAVHRLFRPYTPQLGDTFEKPGSEYTTFDGRVVKNKDGKATVTMTDGRHVVCIINGLEYTMPVKQFVGIAEKTVANGASFRRGTRQIILAA